MNVRNSVVVISNYLLYNAGGRKSYYELLGKLDEGDVLVPSFFVRDFFVNLMLFVVTDYQFSINNPGSYLIPKTVIVELMSELLGVRVWFDDFDNLKCEDCNSVRSTVFSDDFWFRFMEEFIRRYPQLVDDIGRGLLNDSVKLYFGFEKKKGVSLKYMLSGEAVGSLPGKYRRLVEVGEEVNGLLAGGE